MSENKQKNNQDPIESEIINVPEQEDIIEENVQVVVKKGSFLSFVAFILAGSALTVSSYLYVQLKNTGEKVVDTMAWAAPLMDIEKKSEQKFQQLSVQIKQIQKTNSELQEQLKTIETIATNIQSTDITEPGGKYDDSGIVAEIQSMAEQIRNQDDVLNQLKKTVSNNNDKQNQSIRQLQQKANNLQPQNNNVTLLNRNYRYEMAEIFLQSAHNHLNILGNFEKGKEFLVKTQKQLTYLEGVQYQQLAEELLKVIEKISKITAINVLNEIERIDSLSKMNAQLDFITTEKSEDNSQTQQESSWYDKLIVIRKVDETTKQKLTSHSKQQIYQDLSNHYNTMKIALIGNKPKLWMDAINSIESMLEQYFPLQSADIKTQLTQLKTLDINPELPDLSSYLITLQTLNKQEFEQIETPMEIKFSTKPVISKTENN